MSEHDPNELLYPEDAAKYLCTTEQHLQQLRMTGKGPRYIRLSYTRVAYRRGALDDFVASREFSSTSEEKAARTSAALPALPASGDGL